MSLSLTSGILTNFTNNNYFVETGTFTGGGVQVALDAGFKFIRSIEVLEDYHNAAKRTFSKTKNVKLYFGDTVSVLWDVIKDIDEPITFFLDSHLADGDKRASVEVPVLMELDIINRHPIKTHTILIDDRRTFGFASNPGGTVSKEWISITEQEIINKIMSINSQYSISYMDTSNAHNDLLVAEIK